MPIESISASGPAGGVGACLVLTAMLSGRHPLTGEPLGLREVSGRGPVPGFDLTFSAPKPVSLTWAFGGHPLGAEVKAAHAASGISDLHSALGEPGESTQSARRRAQRSLEAARQRLQLQQRQQRERVVELDRGMDFGL